MAMIDDIKVLTNSDDTTLLNLLLTQCKSYAVGYCHLDDYSPSLDEAVVLMVCERFNKLSAEGISSRTYSSISEGYTEDYSPAVYRSLQRNRKLQRVQ